LETRRASGRGCRSALNHTEEHSAGEEIDRHADPGTPPDTSSDERSKFKPSGVIGASYALWVDGSDRLTVFADYRNTYKPAAIDFGPEAEGDILKPETADSWEAGFKGQLADGRVDWELSYFHLNFNNLVIPEDVGGLPSLANGGKELFKGAEIEGDYRVTHDLRLRATYAYHDARYTDRAVLLDDGSIVNYAGNRLEASPQNLAALGLIYTPVRGFEGSVVWNYAGTRFLDQENQTPVGSYTTVDAGIGYRFERWELRLDGYNLSDRRDPVAISELGDGHVSAARTQRAAVCQFPLLIRLVFIQQVFIGPVLIRPVVIRPVFIRLSRGARRRHDGRHYIDVGVVAHGFVRAVRWRNVGHVQAALGVAPLVQGRCCLGRCRQHRLEWTWYRIRREIPPQSGSDDRHQGKQPGQYATD
jgi:TonB dependent receptor